MKPPKVSIVIPSFNRRDFLPRALESVFSQTFQDFEVIVLDDGSTDKTTELLQKWEKAHPTNFRWTSHPNIGQIRTVNKGFQMATGEYLYVLNSDDYLYPECLQHLVNALQNNPDAVLSYGDWEVVDVNDNLIARTANWQLSATEIIRDAIPVSAGVLYTRQIVETIGGWDPDYPVMPDFAFWLAASLKGKFVHVPHLVAVWRSHPGAITVKSRGRRNAEQMIGLYNAYFDQPNLPDEIKAIENEAWRNLFIVCALSMNDVNVSHDGRFSVFDRASWRQDITNDREPIEMQMLAWRNHARRLEALENVRLQTIEAERVHSANLEMAAALAARNVDVLQRQLSTLQYEIDTLRNNQHHLTFSIRLQRLLPRLRKSVQKTNRLRLTPKRRVDN